MSTPLRIATRQSELALWQAEYIKAALMRCHPSLSITLVPMVSRGDKLLDVPLAKVGGKGLFVKELEHALLEHRADIAVHSMKDVPMSFPADLGLAAICARADPRDAFVSEHFADLSHLPAGSVVGTSSLRRQCQLLQQRPDLQVRFLRGNVNTRLRKLDDREYDAIILAAAGLMRLELSHRIRAFIPPEQSLPAAGQGAIGVECRLSDTHTVNLLQALHHPRTASEITAERAVNKRLNGGCQVPIAAYALQRERELWLRALVGSPDGRLILKEEACAPIEQAQALGTTLAERLLDAGADDILQALADPSHG